MKVVIVGTGGFARELHEILELSNRDQQKFEFMGFLDDDLEMHGKEVHDVKVLGGLDWLNNQNADEIQIIVGIGSPYIKRKLIKKVREINDFKFYTLIDKNAIIGKRVNFGQGSIICAGTVITTDITVGNHVTFNLNCTIGHDVIIEDYVTFAPGANISGSLKIGEGTDFGTNAVIIQGKNIDSWSIIGAGAVVVKSIPANTTSVGNPSNIIKERDNDWHLK